MGDRLNTGAPPWTRSDESSGFEFILDSVPEAGAVARRRLEGLASFLPALTLQDLRAVVTELVNNAVTHGSGGPITVAVEVMPTGTARGTVTDGGRGPMKIAGGHEAGNRGLGLRLVDGLASRWGVHAPSSDVWFELAPSRHG
jgi:two-component sensor histidine kinase